MGLKNWFQDKWLMMMRTKPHYISILGRKRSSISSPPKSLHREGKSGAKFGICICVVTMLCSMSHGVLLVLSEGVDSFSLATYLVSLFIAGIVAILSGLCVAEYMNNQPQEAPSIYSICYQYSSEVLAFFIGWTWIVSQIAVISAVCKILTTHVNEWTDDISRKFLEKIFFNYAKDVPSLIFLLVFILFILTGFGQTVVWYALFIPLTFAMISAMYIIDCIVRYNEISVVDSLRLNDIKGNEEILLQSALCILFFSGPQSLLRIPLNQVQKNTTAVLSPLNGIILIITFVFIMGATLFDKSIMYSSSNEMLTLASNVLCAISLCSIGREAFYPLHFVIGDMSSDGLLFRSLSKKCKPFCFPVSSAMVHVLTFISIGLMSVFVPLLEVLSLAAVFPLLIGSTIPYLVLIQRYRDNSSWQYEPMLHTTAKSVLSDRSRRKSEEFQYSHAPGFDITEECEISTTCIDENLTDSTSSDTDVDSVVQQYKEQTHIANMNTLDGAISTNQIPEPTSSSSFRAKCCITILGIISLIVSLTLNFTNLKDPFSIAFILMSLLLSTIVQSLLICLPQNQKLDKSTKCCSKIPRMPWTPGMASIMSCSLLVHVLIRTWKASAGFFIVGALLYFLYGIRSSTAANSFHNMKTTRISLRPLPSYGKSCIPQIIPSQRKIIKSRRYKKLKTCNL